MIAEKRADMVKAGPPDRHGRHRPLQQRKPKSLNPSTDRSTLNAVPYPVVLIEYALCLSRRSVHGSLAMGSRRKAGPGQGSAKVILPAPVYWDYAKAGRRLDSQFLRCHRFCLHSSLSLERIRCRPDHWNRSLGDRTWATIADVIGAKRGRVTLAAITRSDFNSLLPRRLSIGLEKSGIGIAASRCKFH
jgi:hypothetical protein